MRRSETHFSQMTWVVLAFFAVFFLWVCAAHAQVWSCTVNGISCQPGSTGCQCAEVQQAPVGAPPTCPFGTYWNGGVCVQVQQAPVYIPQYVPQYVHPYNPYGNVPFNQQPGWPHH
jgi:hypothetical protein